jgi:hypothetical protein
MPQASHASAFFAAAAAASLAACVFAAERAAGAELSAGGFAFSDELGGFTLISASGAGTPDDPIVIVEEIDEVAPITLVVRRLAPSEGGAGAREAIAPLSLVKVVANRSQRVWAGFEIELQEILRKPSVYADGLSFNQYATRAPDVSSDVFLENDRVFEPFDRVRFQTGHVDPEGSARFVLTITDPTPTATFYIVQDPKLISVERRGEGRSFALLGGRAARPAGPRLPPA